MKGIAAAALASTIACSGANPVATTSPPPPMQLDAAPVADTASPMILDATPVAAPCPRLGKPIVDVAFKLILKKAPGTVLRVWANGRMERWRRGGNQALGHTCLTSKRTELVKTLIAGRRQRDAAASHVSCLAAATLEVEITDVATHAITRFNLPCPAPIPPAAKQLYEVMTLNPAPFRAPRAPVSGPAAKTPLPQRATFQSGSVRCKVSGRPRFLFEQAPFRRPGSKSRSGYSRLAIYGSAWFRADLTTVISGCLDRAARRRFHTQYRQARRSRQPKPAGKRCRSVPQVSFELRISFRRFSWASPCGGHPGKPAEKLIELAEALTSAAGATP